MSIRMSHASRINFCRCRQLYYYKKVQGISVRPEKLADAVKVGSIWDEFNTSLYKGKKFKERLWYLVDYYNLSDSDVARIYALIKAFKSLDMTVNLNGLIGCQVKFDYIDGDVTINGVVDRAYQNFFVESKASAWPDFYHKIHAITSQVSTYFLSNPSYEYCIIEAVRVPSLKTGWGKYSEEPYENYMMRIYRDIISRPSHYFLGFNREEKTFGKKFHKSEFPLDEIARDYQLITKDIQRAIEENAFYQNFMSCHVPSQCDYLKICEIGVASELIYEQKPKQEGGEPNENNST